MGRILFLISILAVVGSTAHGQEPASKATGSVHSNSLDPLLHLDPVDPETGEAAVILPFVPWIRPGPDGVLGTADDLTVEHVLGDVDLVVRAGSPDLRNGVPDPSVTRGARPLGVAAPFGQGVDIPFVVLPGDGLAVSPPPYWRGLPVLVAAFGDLDGDGYIGVTHLDGDPNDTSLEIAELSPLGGRYAIGEGNTAVGAVGIRGGGPRGARLRVALTAASYAGGFEKSFLGGIVPKGPAILTRLPFLPLTDPTRTIRQGLFGLLPAAVNGRIAFNLERAGIPDPAHPVIGEGFTLRLDGSDPTIGIAEMAAGEFARFGPALLADPEWFRPSKGARLRPGLDITGAAAVFETRSALHIADDGAATSLAAQIVPLDSLGNITDPPGPAEVVVTTGGTVRIVSPDSDGDPYREEIRVEDSAGVEIVLDDSGGVFDDANRDHLRLEGLGRRSKVELVLSDPDLDDNGIVNHKDLEILLACDGLAPGSAGFDPALDLDGDGEVGPGDQSQLHGFYGLHVPSDRGVEKKKKKQLKARKWKQSKFSRPQLATELKDLDYDDEVGALRKKKPKAPKVKKAVKNRQKIYCPSG